MGLLVVDEAFDMWERSKTTYDYARFFDDWAQRDIASWVRRDRCHPCVVMWSIGNEIYDMHADQRGTEVTRMLAEEVRKHDPVHHAFTTFGCNYMPWEGGQRCAAWVDAVGYNYGEKYYDRHHLLHPQWKIYGSETASVLSSRGVYHFPIEQSIMAEADQQCSALGNSNTSWGAADLRKMKPNLKR
jgi:beta-galactosidase